MWDNPQRVGGRLVSTVYSMSILANPIHDPFNLTNEIITKNPHFRRELNNTPMIIKTDNDMKVEEVNRRNKKKD